MLTTAQGKDTVSDFTRLEQTEYRAKENMYAKDSEKVKVKNNIF